MFTFVLKVATYGMGVILAGLKIYEARQESPRKNAAIIGWAISGMLSLGYAAYLIAKRPAL